MNAEAQAALRVLVIDDDPSDRAEAKAALLNGSSRPYQFAEAASAQEGLRLCAQPPLPDCIVLDLGLPDATDLEMLARMPRDEHGLLRVPVVVLTGSVQQGRNQAALRAGAQDYVGKAWLRPETLTKAVENAIERLRMARDLHAQRLLADAAQANALWLEGEHRRMQEVSRLKNLFLANMSHELRTPLTAIIGFSDLLHAGKVSPGSPEHERFLGHIRVSGRHLLRLINDVLDLSKVESGKLKFFPEPLSLPAVAGEVGAMLSAEILQKGIEFTIEIEPVLEHLVLDPVRLRQVLFNYLSNAVKFTPAGGRVALHAHAHGAAHFRVEVEDSGIGIAAPDIPGLFAEFHQLDNGYAKQHQGSGLGLALTRQLVEAQGGSVGLRSEPGRGSVFWFVLCREHGSGDAPAEDACAGFDEPAVHGPGAPGAPGASGWPRHDTGAVRPSKSP